MCKFHFVLNTVRSLSLDFESEVLPSGKDFQIKKKTSALRSSISLGALLWLHLGFPLRCLFVFVYMPVVSIPICIYGHTLRT